MKKEGRGRRKEVDDGKGGETYDASSSPPTSFLNFARRRCGYGDCVRMSAPN